jgi:hypothetical protein
MLLTDKTSPIIALIRSSRQTEDEGRSSRHGETHSAATMRDHRSLASPPPPDSGGDRSRASENQVSHTPRWFSNQLEPSS